MPMVWFLQNSGRRVHLAVEGSSDINTPDTAFSPALLSLVGRCRSGKIIVEHPTHGTFTIDLTEGKTGSCNQCGMCCTHPVDYCTIPATCRKVLNTEYNVHACQYLVIDPRPNSLGKPGRTSCSLGPDLLHVHKCCVYAPEKLPWMTSCGFD